MKRMAIAIALLAACGGKNHGDGTGTGTSSASASASADCKAIEPHVRELYHAEATAAASGEDVEEQTTDNVTMVMNDCAAKPDKVAACAGAAKTVAELEKQCLIPLDDEGSEGDRFKETK
jgi:hypothetical protein